MAPKTMAREHTSAGADIRERLLAGAPVQERRLELEGVSTAVLEGGSGAPLVLLHGPGEHALKWMEVFPGLMATHRVIAPDLPGHGASEVTGGPPTAERMLAWLGALIDRTCTSPPTLVGQTAAGAMAARLAVEHGDRIGRLVLADALGLAPFRPAPEFAEALTAYLAGPDRRTFDALWRRCAFDLDRVQDRLGDRWEAIATYTLDRVRAPGAAAALTALMEQFGFPPIPPEDLAKIAVPTTLIWGRHDLATSLAVAEAASARYGWPLHVIEGAGDDPATDQPERFVEVLGSVLAGARPSSYR
jgi:pimeloyl-ACP methyl ester carboxylesterase